MKVLNFFTFLLLAVSVSALLSVVAVITFVRADGKDPKDFQCQICRDFVHRVVVEKESPRTACRPKKNSKNHRAGALMLDGCHFMLKETKLISHLFDLRAKHHRRDVAASQPQQQDLRDACHLHTQSAENNHEGFCPAWEETFGPIKTLHADAAGWDVRVAPASSWMNPNSVRITVVDNAPTNHSAAFLDQFSYNANFKFFSTDKVVHTGVFPVNQTGGVVNVTLGNKELVLPIKTAKQGQGTRILIFGDPCFSGEWVGCKYGKKWQTLERLTELLNVVAPLPDALHMYGILGDNFYDPLLKLAPQFFSKLNRHALATPMLSTNGNHVKLD
jgi:hypothetical protein